MNKSLQIVSKGLYSGEVDKNLPVIVKEYVFAREGKNKCLMLRFENTSSFYINEIDFFLVQKNSDGEEIGSERITLDAVNVRPNAIFSPNVCFFVQEKCSDFEIEFLSVRSENYEYKSNNQEGYVNYAMTKDWRYRGYSYPYCTQVSKFNNKVKFSGVILVFSLILIALAIISPYIITEVIPAIIEGIKTVFEYSVIIIKRIIYNIEEYIRINLAG